MLLLVVKSWSLQFGIQVMVAMVQFCIEIELIVQIFELKLRQHEIFDSVVQVHSKCFTDLVVLFLQSLWLMFGHTIWEDGLLPWKFRTFYLVIHCDKIKLFMMQLDRKGLELWLVHTTEGLKASSWVIFIIFFISLSAPFENGSCMWDGLFENRWNSLVDPIFIWCSVWCNATRYVYKFIWYLG